MMAHDGIIKHQVREAHYANRCCKLSEHFSQGGLILVYLSTKNLSLPKGQAKKLLPKFIGLYKIVEAHTAASMVTLGPPTRAHSSESPPHVPCEPDMGSHTQ